MAVLLAGTAINFSVKYQISDSVGYYKWMLILHLMPPV